MVHRHVMGKEGMTLATVASLAMAAIAYFIAHPVPLGGDMGICFPSPNGWGISALGGWILNLSTLLITCLTIYALNKEFRIVQGSDTVATGMFLVMVMSNIWVSGTLTSSGIMALANMLCLIVLFGCYRKRNAMQEIFVIGTILSICSMIQYAFIFMTPVYLIGAMMLKCFNFKSFIAYLMGLAAPYWVGVGLGIIPIDSFTMPTLSNLFTGYATKSGLFVGLLNVGVTATVGFMLALTNGMRLYAGNTQRRLYNMVINVLGIAAALCMVFDFNNMVVYMATLYMITAIQLGNLFALQNVHHGSLGLFILSLLYVAGFVVMVVS